ncbi:general odorant-binding protein 19d-like [Atheta coriaria]|uniref:general odorant-binding protein 19d-like n=1 Tax=Dalotia coriaria TaxID=877792 RepID=UPI0031F38EFC
MKFIVAFVLCVVVVNAELSKEFQEAVLKKVMEVGEKCAKQENASQQDIDELMTRKNPSRKEGKCLIACFNEEFGVQGKDGKMSKDGVMAALAPYKAEDEGLYNKLVKLLTEDCMPQVKSSDRCEAAAELDACYHQNADDEIKKADAIF